jgi:3-oxoacyl-[acyl-carrier-protein] synthase-3
MRACEIAGYGTYLPDHQVRFGSHVRHRIADDVSLLDMLESAAVDAIAHAGISADAIDCIIGASAAGVQPIPCTAALLQERLAPRGETAAFDVNSTCTSFITAVDIASRYIADGEYSTILIVSGDVGTRFLNPDQKEAFELFSDAAVAVVLSATDRPDTGVVASLQQTWAAYAHSTELRGGLAGQSPQKYPESPPADYLFDMDGRAALLGIIRELPGFFARFYERSGLTIDLIDLVIPHQASRALPLAMRRVGIPASKFVDDVERYGNMVSASVPYILVDQLRSGRIGEGDTVLLCGTAAGLTANALALRL